ncbi:MAG: ATP-binding cassette subfamily C protein LapB, partial [Candidatus Latescibacterota bacterium]
MNQATAQTIGPYSITHPLSQCLRPLLEALEWQGTESEMVQALPSNLDDMTPVAFLNVMAQLGFRVQEFESKISRLHPSLLPCLVIDPSDRCFILHHDENDPILVFDGESACYLDPSQWPDTGQVYVFTPIGRDDVSLLERQQKWFAQLLARFRKLFISNLLLSFVISLLSLASPIFIMAIYKQMAMASPNRVFISWLLGSSIYIVAHTGFRFLRTYLMEFSSVRMANIVSNQVMRQLLYLPPSYTETVSIGPQLARIRDFETVRNFFAGPAAAALFDLPFIIFLIAGVVVIGGAVAYVPFVSVLLFIMFGFGIIQFSNRSNVQKSKAGSQKQEFLLEMLSGLVAVKYTGSRERWRKRYQTLSADAALNAYDTTKIQTLVSTVSQVIITCALIATIGVSTHRVLNGDMSTGALLACIFLVSRILAPLRTGFFVLIQLDRIRQSIRQIDRFMALPQERRSGISPFFSGGLVGKISFSQVGLRYSPDAFPALVGVSFDLEKGEILSIVGHEGSGATSILKLILGMYVPQIGRVLIDDMNIRQLDPITLRSSIAYVPEVGHLFQGTIAENFRLVA